jgi:hypothetical protein
VAYEVRTELADSRPLAAIRATTTQQRLGRDIVGLLDVVWPVLREQAVPAGQNVVIYYGASAEGLTIDVGVEVPAGFADRSQVRRVCTPAGEVATVAYFGEYS